MAQGCGALTHRLAIAKSHTWITELKKSNHLLPAGRLENAGKCGVQAVVESGYFLRGNVASWGVYYQPKQCIVEKGPEIKITIHFSIKFDPLEMAEVSDPCKNGVKFNQGFKSLLIAGTN